MKKINLVLIALPLAALLTGCASSPSRFYTLNATAAKVGADPIACAVLVSPAVVPAVVDRSQIVVSVDANRVEMKEFNRWADPLPESISRVTAMNLANVLGASRVASAPVVDFGPAYRVNLRVERFESPPPDSPRGSVIVDVIWSVRNPSGSSVDTGHSIITEPLMEKGFDGLAQAHSRALARVGIDIAAAIRIAEKEKR